MKPLTKILFTLSVSLLFIGCVLCGVAYVMGGTTLAKLDIDTKYTEKTLALASDNIDTIKIDSDYHKIFVKQSSYANTITITYAENEYDTFFAKEENNTLSFTNKHKDNGFFKTFCMFFDKSNSKGRVLTITIPQYFSGTIDITTENADIDVTAINRIENLNVKATTSDIVFSSVYCTNASIKLDAGDITLLNGNYDNLTLDVSNNVEMVPIDKVPGATVLPTETPMESALPTLRPSTPTPRPTQTPAPTPEEASIMPIDETAAPSATPNASATPGASATPEATETPEPTATPKPTKTPTVATVVANITFNGVDCKNLTITANNTNIVGYLARTDMYYNIETNNTESSNIQSVERVNPMGAIKITQKGGKTELAFR